MYLSDYIEEKPILKTDRLLIRQLVKDDVDSLRLWTPDNEIYKYWGKSRGKADKDPSLLFVHDEKRTKSFHWGIEQTDIGKVIGDIWIFLIENERMAKIAYRIGRQYQGKGYATEAVKEVVNFCFLNTELKRLWSDVVCENVASAKVLEKAGFMKEGLIRQGKMGNLWCDYYVFGMLREDFCGT